MCPYVLCWITNCLSEDIKVFSKSIIWWKHGGALFVEPTFPPSLHSMISDIVHKQSKNCLKCAWWIIKYGKTGSFQIIKPCTHFISLRKTLITGRILVENIKNLKEKQLWCLCIVYCVWEAVQSCYARGVNNTTSPVLWAFKPGLLAARLTELTS